MKNSNLIIFYLFCSITTWVQQSVITLKNLQLKWHQTEMGAVFHYDLHVFNSIYYKQVTNRINIIGNYNIFNPTELNTKSAILLDAYSLF